MRNKKKTIFMETTEVTVNKSVAQIQATLADYGATAILVEYDNFEVVAISFKYITDGVEYPYRFPTKWEEVKKLLIEKTPSWKFKKDINDLAKRVAWRQAFRWIEAQLAYADTNQVTFEQIFLSYMQGEDGKTLFERMQELKFNLRPLLGYRKEG